MMLVHPEPQEGVAVENRSIPVEGGEIRVRTYRPDGLPVPSPTLFFVHGGGWFQGDLDTAEVECGPMASMVPCFMVSVEYRLAPEHKFPTPLNDCVTARALWSLRGPAHPPRVLLPDVRSRLFYHFRPSGLNRLRP